MPVVLSGSSVYVVAPLGLITTLPPLQITLLLDVAVIVGVGFTVSVKVSGLLGAQPLAVPFTVYTVVVVAFDVGVGKLESSRLILGVQV